MECLNERLLKRIVVIGNSGSGKSFLALELAKTLHSEVTHFDEHFWEPGGFDKRRPAQLVHEEIRKLSTAGQWIMEGVFGDLAATALPNATALIFLNKSWEECRSGLLERGSQTSKQKDPVAAEKSFQELLAWAEAYYARENSRSLPGHKKLFLEFKGFRQELNGRKATGDFIAALNKSLGPQP
jgi:adenylate kinase family enzyme